MPYSFSNWASNKAVKIISHLLPFLPDNYKYKIIFMQRNMDEIILSQKKLLERAGKKTREKTYPFLLAEAFKKNLERVNKWQQEKQNVELLYMSYTDIINNPANEARKVNGFFNNILDAENIIIVNKKKTLASGSIECKKILPLLLKIMEGGEKTHQEKLRRYGHIIKVRMLKR